MSAIKGITHPLSLIKSKTKRTKQWAVFSKLWYLYDAKWQNPFDSAEKICKVLQGRHKPIFDDLADVGDHVVVINTKEIAMPNEEWRYRMYSHHTQYAGGQTYTPAWELHEKDPTQILYKAVYRQIGGNLLRRGRIQKLHLFPDDKIPLEILENVSDQLRQLCRVPKKIEEYSEEELKNFPKLFEWPKDYVIK